MARGQIASSWLRPIVEETAKTLLLLALMVVTVWAVLEVLGGGVADGAWYERMWSSFAAARLDANGLPIAPRFFAAAAQSLAIVSVAAIILACASFTLGSVFVLRPTSSVLRFPLGLVSAVPAFMFPFLGVPLESAVLWPAVCLAIGDLNLASLTAHCYEGLRREWNEPYVRTARSLGLSPWNDLWPRAVLVALEGIRARIPHLLGGTVAIEYVFNVHGVGHLALSSVLGARPDYNVLIWIAGLGIVATRVLSLVHRVARSILTPERGRRAAWGSAAVHSAPAEIAPDDSERAASIRSVAVASPPVDAELPRATHRTADRAARSHANWFATAEPPEPITLPSAGTRWRQRWSAFWNISAANRVKTVLALATAMAGIALLSVIAWGGAYTPLETDEAFLPASLDHPLGTNAMGEDLLSNVAQGGRQLLLPLSAAVAVAVIIGGVFGVWSGLQYGSAIDTAFDLYAELWESVPKLILVLAAITYISFEHYALKLYMLIGVAFAPVLYRAVRDEVGALRTSLFLEASVTLGVSRWRIFTVHVLRNHAMPVLCVHGAVMVGYVLLFDAILGYCSVRQYGEVFTWGSLIGTGLDELPRYEDAGLAVNSLIVWGPLVAMVVAIACSNIVGDALKSLGRSVRFSR